MTIPFKYLGFGTMLLLAVILAFSPIDEIALNQPSTTDLINLVTKESNYIEVEEVAHMIIDKDPSIQVIDIRSQNDYKKYHIPGAYSIPLEDLFGFEADEILDSEKMIVLVSNGNTTASQAWLLMRSKSYSDLYVLHGGMNHWVNTFSNPDHPKQGVIDDELFAYQFRKSAGAVMMGTNGSIESSGAGNTLDKPKPVKRKKKKKKKTDDGC